LSEENMNNEELFDKLMLAREGALLSNQLADVDMAVDVKSEVLKIIKEQEESFPSRFWDLSTFKNAGLGLANLDKQTANEIKARVYTIILKKYRRPYFALARDDSLFAQKEELKTYVDIQLSRAVGGTFLGFLERSQSVLNLVTEGEQLQRGRRGISRFLGGLTR